MTPWNWFLYQIGGLGWFICVMALLLCIAVFCVRYLVLKRQRRREEGLEAGLLTSSTDDHDYVDLSRHVVDERLNRLIWSGLLIGSPEDIESIVT